MPEPGTEETRRGPEVRAEAGELPAVEATAEHYAPMEIVGPDGQPVFVQPEQTQSALGSGMASPADSNRQVVANVLNEHGVPEARVMSSQRFVELQQDAMASGNPGAITLASGSEEQTAIAHANTNRTEDVNLMEHLDANYGGEAAVNAFSSIMTLGLSSTLQNDVVRRRQAQIAEANPGWTGAGMLAGVGFSMLASGGLGSLAGATRGGGAIRALAGGPAGLGSNLARGIEGVSATSRIGQATRFVSSQAADGFANSIAFNTAEAALHNRPLTAEQILGDGMLFTALGMGFSGIGRLARAGTSRAERLVNGVRSDVRAAERAERTIQAQAESRVRAEALSSFRPNSTALTNNLRAVDANFSTLRGSLNTYRDSFRGVSFDGGNLLAARNSVDSLLTARSTLRQAAESATPAEASVLNNAANAISELRNSHSPAYNMSRADTVNSVHKTLFDAERVLTQAHHPATAAEATRLRTILADESVFGVNAAKIQRVRDSMDSVDLSLASVRERLSKTGATDSFSTMAHKDLMEEISNISQLRTASEDLLSANPGMASAKRIRANYDKLENTLRQRESISEKVMERMSRATAARDPAEVALDTVARDLPYTKALLDSGPASMLIGSVVGNGVGAGAGALIARAISPSRVFSSITGVRKVMTKFERSIIRNNDRLSKAIRSTDRVIRNVERSRPMAPVVASLRSGTREEREAAFDSIRGQLTALGTNPQRLTNDLSMSSVDIRSLDEVIADTVQMRAVMALQIAMEAMPKQQGSGLVGSSRRAAPSATELDDFSAVLDGLLSPSSLYDDINSGMVNPKKAKAVAQGFPQIYNTIMREVGGVLSSALQEGHAPNYQMSISIANATGIQTDATQDSQFIQAMQSTAAQTEQTASTISTAGQLQGPRRGTGTNLSQITSSQAQRTEFS